SPNGRYMAAAGPGGTVTIGDIEAARLPSAFRAHVAAIHSLAFTPDGTRLVTTRRASNWIEPSEMKLWDARTGQELLTFGAPTYRWRSHLTAGLSSALPQVRSNCAT